MEEKEKGYQLYEKFFVITPEDLTNDECVKFAKQCALIAVDEVLAKDGYNNDYWNKVKQEILNL